MLKKPSRHCFNITVAARDSALSKAQVEEVYQELKVHHPKVVFHPFFAKTKGDKDRKTSLRFLGKCDFFTKEIDELVLTGTCAIGIHSAKDLPEPLPKGLSCVALTKGIDSSDALVLNSSIKDLPRGALIATSSLRREELVSQLRADLVFVDIRGTIEERLQTLFSGKVQGVVVAEAALIRLKLTHLNRVKLPGETPPLQGRLAIIARADDAEMHAVFKCLDFG